MKLFNLVLLFVLISCASEEEKEERRQNAFDLSGTYISSIKTGSELNMSLEIINENGRHDIYANLERNSILNAKEKSLLNKHGISLSPIENSYLPQMVLGRNSDKNSRVYHLDGGENISDDFGETSKFHICSVTKEVNGTLQPRAKSTNYHIYYCLNGEIKKNDFILRGNLGLYIRKEYVEEKKGIDDEGKEYTYDQTIIEYDEAMMAFQSDASSVFYNQLKGQWSGQILADQGVEDDLSVFNTIFVNFEGNDNYYLEPVKSKAITYMGETYNFKKITSKIDQLRNASVPLVEMHFVNGNEERRLILVGQIFSLGRFTGSIIHFDENIPEGIQLASFEHKKD